MLRIRSHNAKKLSLLSPCEGLERAADGLEGGRRGGDDGDEVVEGEAERLKYVVNPPVLHVVGWRRGRCDLKNERYFS